jgi:transposase-like protein
MKFGIVVCPRCKKAKVVDLSCKTTKCHRCGKVLRLEHLKILYKSNSDQKIRQAWGLVNAEMDGRLEDFKELMK